MNEIATQSPETGHQEGINLKEVVTSVVDCIGGSRKVGQIFAEQFMAVSDVDLSQIPVNQRSAHRSLQLRYSAFIANLIKDSDKLQLDGGLESMKTEDLQDLVVPLMVEWVRNDEFFCRRMIETVRKSDPGMIERLAAGSPLLENSQEVISG